MSKLTPHEKKIVGLIKEGLTNRQIAEKLMISPNTVRWEVRLIMTKLGLRAKNQHEVCSVRDLLKGVNI